MMIRKWQKRSTGTETGIQFALTFVAHAAFSWRNALGLFRYTTSVRETQNSRVQSPDAERADDEPGHDYERPVKSGIVLPIS